MDKQTPGGGPRGIDMAAGYVLGIDQSTQGTKLLLFDRTGAVAARTYQAHRQLVNDRGWVSHDMEEVYGNVIAGVRELLEKAGIAGKDIAVLGISNQRETTVAWDNAGNPICPAIVWQCGRAAGIVEKIGRNPADAEKIRSCTGIPLSPDDNPPGILQAVSPLFYDIHFLSKPSIQRPSVCPGNQSPRLYAPYFLSWIRCNNFRFR